MSGPKNRVVCVLLAVLAVFGLLVMVAPQASAHHAGCYVSVATSPVTKKAWGSATLEWFVPAESGGFHANKMNFRPAVRGHSHSCLYYGNGPASVTYWALGNDAIYTSIQYWDSSARVWVNGGPWYFYGSPDLSSPRSKYSYRDPRVFTHARLSAWYWDASAGAYSVKADHITCKLGDGATTAASCWEGN